LKKFKIFNLKIKRYKNPKKNKFLSLHNKLQHKNKKDRKKRKRIKRKSKNKLNLNLRKRNNHN
jgi:hypothetical protein